MVNGHVFNFEFPLCKSIVSGMRRVCILAGVFLGLAVFRLPAPGQEAAATSAPSTNAAPANPAATNAAAVAEQQGVDERFKQLAADIERLRAAAEALGDKLSSLKGDLQQIRQEQARLESNVIGPEELKSLAANLAGKIEEVDKKRMEDKELISDQIKQTAIRLERLITDTAPAPGKPATPSPPAGETGPYSYTLKEGDTLEVIVKYYNAYFREKGMKTITEKQAEEANPSVTDWKKTKVGQVINIPHPPD